MPVGGHGIYDIQERGLLPLPTLEEECRSVIVVSRESKVGLDCHESFREPHAPAKRLEPSRGTQDIPIPAYIDMYQRRLSLITSFLQRSQSSDFVPGVRMQSCNTNKGNVRFLGPHFQNVRGA